MTREENKKELLRFARFRNQTHYEEISENEIEEYLEQKELN
jgi:hypothetical protein